MKALTVLTFKTATTVFYVCCGKVTLARCAKTGRFVKLAKAKRVFQNLLIVARKYVAACKVYTKTANKAVYTQADNMLSNAFKFLKVDKYVKWGANDWLQIKNTLTILVA